MHPITQDDANQFSLNRNGCRNIPYIKDKWQKSAWYSIGNYLPVRYTCATRSVLTILTANFLYGYQE